MAEIRGVKFEVEGLNELNSQFKRIGKMPKKHLTRAAKLGSDDTLKDAKASAPVSNKPTKGTLKKGIKRNMETPNKRNKSVYRIWWNPKYSGVFRGEKIKRPGLYGASPAREYAYYPQSVEYGFKTKKGRVNGRYFVAKAIEKNEKNSMQKIVKSLNRSITELTNKSE